MEFLRIFGSLVLVFGLLGGLLWGLKRLQLRIQPGQPGRRLQVLESTSVGPRQKLALVRVGTQELLVGVSPGHMTALGQWTVAEGETPADHGQALRALAQELRHEH